MGEMQQGLPAQYQAWVWREGHDVESLTQVSLAVSPLADDEVLVANKVIGLNPVDWKVLGHLPGNPAMSLGWMVLVLLLPQVNKCHRHGLVSVWYGTRACCAMAVMPSLRQYKAGH
ncbi:hypothetical protein ABC733_24090 [Mangrovibacter sp. SLW1]